MKNILFLSLFFQSIISYGQIGINVTNPQGMFHIDSGKNNSVVEAPLDEILKQDDFVVLPNGNVGVGTVTPTAKLEVKSPNGPSFRLKDGTEGDGKTLISDLKGNASWKYLGLDVHLGVFKLGRDFKLDNISGNNYNFNPDNPTSNFYGTGSYIDLPPGKWLVVFDLYAAYSPVLDFMATGIPLSKEDWVWLRYSFSDEDGYVSPDSSVAVSLSEDFEDLNNRITGGGLSGPSGNNTRALDSALTEDVHGQFVLNNSTTNKKRYFLVAGAISSSKNSLPGYLRAEYFYGAFYAIPTL